MATVISTKLSRPSASFTRPADTTAYASGDLVANSTTAGSVVPLEFTVGEGSADTAYINRIYVRKSGTSITNATFRVHLFQAAPTPANGDNGAFSVSQAATYIGSADVVVTQAFTDGAVGSLMPVGNFFQIVLSSGLKVYALLEARAAYTPVSGEIFTVALDLIEN